MSRNPTDVRVTPLRTFTCIYDIPVYGKGQPHGNARSETVAPKVECMEKRTTSLHDDFPAVHT